MLSPEVMCALICVHDFILVHCCFIIANACRSKVTRSLAKR